MLCGIYVGMASAYVLFHQKHINSGAGISAITITSGIQRDNSSGNLYTQLHGAFKSIVENKRKPVTLLFTVITPGFVLIFSSLQSAYLITGSVGFNSPQYLKPHSYLSLRTLRI